MAAALTADELSNTYPVRDVPLYEASVTKYPHEFRFTFGPHPDAQRAYEIQRDRAIRNGQRWSERHAYAIRELHEAYIRTGLGVTRGRTAWPLAVGTGKSESLVAFALAQYERSLAGLRPLTLLVCMERAAQLSDLYREIIATGVPESFVGVYHRKTPAEVSAEKLCPSVALADVTSFPILLATHAKMLRGDASIAEVNTYDGAPRSLVVWDESLIKSQGHHLDLGKVEVAAAVFGMTVADTTTADLQDARDAHRFIADRLSVLRADFQRQTSGAPVEPVVFPPLDEGDELRFAAALSSVLLRRGDMERGAHELLAEFLDHVQRPVRVLPYMDAGRRVGVIRFETLIPSSLTRLIVLDASHNIRLLTGAHDADLTVTGVDCAVKSFASVTVRHLRIGAGRNTLAEALPRRNSVVLREIVAEIASWPPDEGGLVVTFKQSPRDTRRGKLSHEEHIRAAMRDAGLNPDATLAHGRRRYSFITWGQHLGVNTFAYCSRVLLVGVLRRAPLDLSSAIAGQRGDLTAPQAADPDAVRKVELSEMFHNVIQAAGRGACRTTVDGCALPMHLAMLCNDEFPAEWWQSAMPGVRVQSWKATHAKPERVLGEREGAALRALASVDGRTDYVSARALKSLAGLDALPPMTSTRVLQRAAAKAVGWRYDSSRRGFVRSPFPAE